MEIIPEIPLWREILDS